VNKHALFVRRSPPPDDSLPNLLGKKTLGDYRNVLSRLASLGLEPEWAWAGQAHGWTVRFRHGESTVCRLVFTQEPLVAQVGVGRQQLETLRAPGALPGSILKLLEATPESGSLRTAEIPITDASSVMKLVTLSDAKLRILRAPSK